MEINIENKNKKIFGLLLGAKRKIFGEKVNYAYSMLQIGFNMNNKDQGNIYDDINKKNEITTPVSSMTPITRSIASFI